MRNEVKVSEMVQILDEHQQYVPCSSSIVEVDIREPGEVVKLYSIHKILYHGDQLTVERMRGAQGIRLNSEDEMQQLKGFIPTVADWHAKVSFLGVSARVKICCTCICYKHTCTCTGYKHTYMCMYMYESCMPCDSKYA